MAIPSEPYHSIDPTDPDVHHIYEDCPNGQQIPDRNRRDGTNGWPLCGQLREHAELSLSSQYGPTG